MNQIFEYIIMHVDYPLLSRAAQIISLLALAVMLGIINCIGKKLIKHLFS